MLAPVSFYNFARDKKNPSFGSVVLSRVVLQKIQPNGDIFYTTLKNDERGIGGIFQSLSLRINKAKDSSIIKKLAAGIPDLKTQSPVLHSTKIGVRSSFRRYLLTGKDARMARDLGHDLIGVLGDKQNYASIIKKDILSEPSKRIFNFEGEEIAVDLIVEGTYGKRKLVDVEISTVKDISVAKPPVLASHKSLKELTLPEQKLQENATQDTFTFFDDVKDKHKQEPYYD